MTEVKYITQIGDSFVYETWDGKFWLYRPGRPLEQIKYEDAVKLISGTMQKLP